VGNNCQGYFTTTRIRHERKNTVIGTQCRVVCLSLCNYVLQSKNPKSEEVDNYCLFKCIFWLSSVNNAILEYFLCFLVGLLTGNTSLVVCFPYSSPDFHVDYTCFIITSVLMGNQKFQNSNIFHELKTTF
jgi:hypothetical protein